MLQCGIIDTPTMLWPPACMSQPDICRARFAQGMVQGEELLQAYASADVFMMPSESETLGFVVLEAMASGLPVVAVAAGGLTDILTEPGETGGGPADHAAPVQCIDAPSAGFHAVRGTAREQHCMVKSCIRSQ